MLKNREKTECRVGVHVSIAGGISKALDRAVQLDCNTVQIFTHSPRQWKKSLIPDDQSERFIYLKKKHDIRPVFVHASYLINLASHSPEVVERSIDLLSYELHNADKIDAEYVVLHTGSAQGDDKQSYRKRASGALRKSLEGCGGAASIILENTAGQKGDITSSIQALSDIMALTRSKRVAGICIDTCHAFASGYDIRTLQGIGKLFEEIKKYIGMSRLKLIHLNDSKKPCCSAVDRHEHIGRGKIGLMGFRNILSDNRVTGVPMILETPKDHDEDDRMNLDRVRSLLK